MLEQQKAASKESSKQGRKTACDLYSKGPMKRSVEDAEFDIIQQNMLKSMELIMTSLSPMKERKKGSKSIGSLSDKNGVQDLFVLMRRCVRCCHVWVMRSSQ